MDNRAPFPPEQPAVNGRPWALPLVLLAALAMATGLLLKFRPPQTPSPATDSSLATDGWTSPPMAAQLTATVAVDFGNGARRELALPWNAGMTVGDLMAAAEAHRPGLRVSRQGSGPMTLLTSIDGVANQGPGGRAWLYRVNDRPGETSYAIHPLAAGDRVLWVFSPPE